MTSRLDSEVERLKARVTQLERERTDVEAFAAVAAHELMEPLVMIEVHAAMLGAGAPGDPAESAEQIGRAAARLRRLVEAILHDGRAAEQGVARRPVDLDRVLRDVLMLLRPEIEARTARVEVEPLPTVPGDEPLLGSLFTNLITNALKYGPRAHGTIRIGAEPEGAGWRVSVADESPPIRAAERERIFEPFQRGQRERRARGTGLGLSICRRIAERHGGRLELAAGEAGNVFSFSLPDPLE